MPVELVKWGRITRYTVSMPSFGNLYLALLVPKARHGTLCSAALLGAQCWQRVFTDEALKGQTLNIQ